MVVFFHFPIPILYTQAFFKNLFLECFGCLSSHKLFKVIENLLKTFQGVDVLKLIFSVGANTFWLVSFV